MRKKKPLIELEPTGAKAIETFIGEQQNSKVGAKAKTTKTKSSIKPEVLKKSKPAKKVKLENEEVVSVESKTCPVCFVPPPSKGEVRRGMG